MGERDKSLECWADVMRGPTAVQAATAQPDVITIGESGYKCLRMFLERCKAPQKA